MIEDLQRRLEVGEDAADILAFEAYAMLTFNLSRQNFDGQHPPTIISGPKFVGQSGASMDPLAVSAANLEKNGELQVKGLVGGLECPLVSDEYQVAAPNTSNSRPNYGSPTNQSDTSEAQPTMEGQGTYPIAPRISPAGSASNTAQLQPVYFPIQTGPASTTTERSSTSTNDSSKTSTQWQAAPSTTPSSLHSAEAADMHIELTKVHQGPTHNGDTAEMPTSSLSDLAWSSRPEGDSLPLDTCDPKDLIKKSK